MVNTRKYLVLANGVPLARETLLRFDAQPRNALRDQSNVLPTAIQGLGSINHRTKLESYCGYKER